MGTASALSIISYQTETAAFHQQIARMGKGLKPTLKSTAPTNRSADAGDMEDTASINSGQ